MTFKEYLASRRITDTPQGDFTEDARRDTNFPDATSWSELKSYLERKVPIRNQDDVLDAARQVWRTYQARLRKN